MSRKSINGIVWKTVQEIDHKATGEEMRARRNACGKSLRDISAKMGISTPYLADLERGFRNWTEEKAFACLESLTK